MKNKYQNKNKRGLFGFGKKPRPCGHHDADFIRIILDEGDNVKIDPETGKRWLTGTATFWRVERKK